MALADPRHQEQLEQLRYLLAHSRVRSALELVNQFSRYRFSAIFRINAGDLDNLIIVDRTSPATPRMDTIPVTDSYCLYVRDHKDAFIVEDADLDGRVVDHPKRPVVKAYCGVPIRRTDGSIFGTICHFDFDPVIDDPDAQWWLEQVADLFDPAASSSVQATQVERTLDALEAMLGLLIETSDSLPVATEALEDFAQPIRSRIAGLSPELAAPANARLQRLLASLPAHFAHNT